MPHVGPIDPRAPTLNAATIRRSESGRVRPEPTGTVRPMGPVTPPATGTTVVVMGPPLFTIPFAAVAAAALGALRAPAQDAPRLVLHFDDPVFEREAEACIARVWKVARTAADVAEARRGTVHVYNDVVSNQEIAAKHGATPTQSSPGFVDEKGDAAHVIFWRCGWCRDAEWRIGSLTMQLALAQASPLSLADAPLWWEHGLAAWAEGIGPSSDGWVEARSHMTRTSPSMQVVKGLGRRLPSIEDVLLERTGALREQEVESVHRVALHFLMTSHRDATCSAARDATTRGSRAEVREAMLEGLRQHLAADVLTGLDEGFRAHVAALPRTVDLQAYPEPDGKGRRGGDETFVPPSPAVMWLDTNRRSKFTLTATPQLVQVGQGDLVFERRRGEWVRITLLGQDGMGSVHVSERQVGDDGRPSGWKILGTTDDDVEALRLGRAVALEVRVTPRRLTVHIDRKRVLTAELPGSLTGRYGVGGPFGNQVAWRDVRLKTR